MIIISVIDGKVQPRFIADHDETEYLLDDGSKMRVAVCKPCKAKLTDKDQDSIMASVVEGWRNEMRDVKWTQEKKDDYMKRYSKKKIICKIDNMSKEHLDKKLKEHKEK